MPTILNINGFRFVIWPSDHEPPHVHVFKGKGEAKVYIGSGEMAPSFVLIHDLTKREARQIWDIVAEHQNQLLNAWEGIHGNLDN
ncbi:MAG: hypothetical protein A2511_12020 [Deltaproteobacteria bacterium RIFOXYD12_FULL_50_9]|nr:MAG: hypothetical protein A2511_12020 [Deltaproteobacteria bacterium RIFOXYD12_FULL_50_9]